MATWEILPNDKPRFESLFRRVGDVGFVSGPQFSALSQLAVGDAGHIFKLADFDRDLKLNKREFAVAMFLAEKKRGGTQIPNSLPPSLIDSSSALFPPDNMNAPFNPAYNPNVPPPSNPSYNPNLPSPNPIYNPNIPPTNPSYNPSIPAYNPNLPPATNPNYNSNNAPPLNRTFSQPLPQSLPIFDLSKDKDTIIANLQTQLAQAHDARLHAENARKNVEDLLQLANVKIAHLEATAHQHAATVNAHAPPPFAPHSPTITQSQGSPSAARIPGTPVASTLEALDMTVNTCTSAPEMDALCVRLKAVLVRAKQRKVELDQVVQQRKIEELESSLTCPICMDQKKNVSCVPCGHALCRACADAVSSRGNRKCPICREEVRQTNPIYL